jgi:hypothetical protein
MAKSTCSIDGCEKPVLSRGWCSAHWTRWSRHGDPLSGGIDRLFGDPFDRVMARTERIDDCLAYMGSRTADEYGYLTVNKAKLYAHRIVAERHLGPAPADRPYVLHLCDHPWCVEIIHLRYGTQAENIEDALRRGRMHQKLTVEQVLAIRADTRSKTVIAADYGTTRTNVHAIQSGRTWKHI